MQGRVKDKEVLTFQFNPWREHAYWLIGIAVVGAIIWVGLNLVTFSRGYPSPSLTFFVLNLSCMVHILPIVILPIVILKWFNVQCTIDEKAFTLVYRGRVQRISLKEIDSVLMLGQSQATGQFFTDETTLRLTTAHGSGRPHPITIVSSRIHSPAMYLKGNLVAITTAEGRGKCYLIAPKQPGRVISHLMDVVPDRDRVRTSDVQYANFVKRFDRYDAFTKVRRFIDKHSVG